MTWSGALVVALIGALTIARSSAWGGGVSRNALGYQESSSQSASTSSDGDGPPSSSPLDDDPRNPKGKKVSDSVKAVSNPNIVDATAVVLFDKNSIDLGVDARAAVADIAKRAKSVPAALILIRGLVDPKANTEDGGTAANRRAQSVQAELAHDGIDAKLMTIKVVSKLSPSDPRPTTFDAVIVSLWHKS